MIKVKLTGQARHRFWGEYSAHICLRIKDKDQLHLIDSVIEKLNKGIQPDKYMTAAGSMQPSSGFRKASTEVISVEAANEKEGGHLFNVKQRLVAFGADEKAILSIKHSIDYGQRFEIEVEVDDPNQKEFQYE